MKRWVLVNDYLGRPACYYAGTVQEAAEQFAKDVEGATVELGD